MRLKVFVAFKPEDPSMPDKQLAITVPRKWLVGPVTKLLSWFVEYYNGKFPGSKIDLEQTCLTNAAGLRFAPESVIQETLSDKETIYVKNLAEVESKAKSASSSGEEKLGLDGGVKLAPTLGSSLDMEDLKGTQDAEARLKKQMKTLRKLHGLDHDATLQCGFRLIEASTIDPSHAHCTSMCV